MHIKLETHLAKNYMDSPLARAFGFKYARGIVDPHANIMMIETDQGCFSLEEFTSLPADMPTVNELYNGERAQGVRSTWSEADRMRRLEGAVDMVERFARVPRAAAKRDRYLKKWDAEKKAQRKSPKRR